MLVYPTETVDLRKANRELCVTSMSVPPNETNCLWVGSEDGSISQIHIHETQGGGSGRNLVNNLIILYKKSDTYKFNTGQLLRKLFIPIIQVDSLSGHEGPVTAVSCHPHEKFANDLLLSGSFDWSVNLYTTAKYNSPLLSLSHYEEYVTDCAWSPTHPAVFGVCDAGGNIEVFNLNEELELPRVKFQAPTGGNAAPSPWHKLSWDTGGRRLAAGNIDGKVTIFQLQDQKLWAPKNANDEANTLMEKISLLQPHEQKEKNNID